MTTKDEPRDEIEQRARLAYNPRDERANRQCATIRLGFDCYHDERGVGSWSADSREFRTGVMGGETRQEALRDALVFALRLLADSIEEGEAKHNRRGEPVVEWKDEP
jgi:hypothetical protein